MSAEVWLIPFAFFASFLIGLAGIGAGSVFTSGLILFLVLLHSWLWGLL